MGVWLALCLAAALLAGLLHPDRKRRARAETASVAAAGRSVLGDRSAERRPHRPVAARKKTPRSGGKAVTAPAPPVVVAVVDGGVDVGHPALAGHLWTNPTEIPGNGIDDDHDGIVDDVHGANLLARSGDPHDESGHGTHVAGIVAAADPSAKVMALKAGSREWIDLGAATAAVRYAVDHGARIVNLSWAFVSGDPALDQAIRDASARGVLVVAAAGNFGTDNDVRPVYPASYRAGTLLSVAATCDGRSVAPFSDWGKRTVAIAAPGCDVLSTLPGGRFGSLSGTSMAAPAVAGAAALLLETHPRATAQQLERALLGGAQPADGLTSAVASGAALSVSGAEAALVAPDRTPPTAPVRVSPSASFETVRDPAYYYADVSFSWTPSGDANLAGYRVVVDGAAVAATPPGTTSVTVKVPPGSHSWTVVAYDRSGNETAAAG